MLLEDVEDILDIKIEDEDVDTIGGWLYAQLGGEPHVGQQSSYEGNIFSVEEVDGLRITRVLVQLAKNYKKTSEEIEND